MTESRVDTPRWVVSHIDKRMVRCAKKLAIQHDIRIAHVLEVAIYQLYANPERLNGYTRDDGSRVRV